MRADGGGRQIDQLVAARPEECVVPPVSLGGGRIEDHRNLIGVGHPEEALDSLVRGGDAQPAGAGQTVGIRINADEGRRLQNLRCA
jgi:hypothetical protein